MIQGDGYQVVGATVGGPEPLGRVQLDLQPGLTVLYGLNASGKTQLLTALAEAMGASRPEREPASRELLVHVEPGAGTASGWLRDARDAIGAALEEQATERLRSDRAFEATDLLEEPPTEIEALIESVAEMSLWLEDPSVIKRIATDLRLVLDGDGPRLRLGPAVTIDALFDSEADWLMWESIEWWDNFVGAMRGQHFPEHLGRAHLWKEAIMNDRLLDPVALRSIDQGKRGESQHREGWNAYPIGAFGYLKSSPVHLVGWQVDPDSLRRRTLASIRHSKERFVDAVLDDEIELTQAVSERVDRLVARANDLLGLVLLDAPPLRLHIGTPTDWLDATMPVWEANDRPSGRWIDLAYLSSAQLRWAVLAIELALAEAAKDRRPTVVLLDEPEAALHRSAEAHLVRGLKRLAVELDGAAVVVASHSPVFLADPGVRPVHVFRSLDGLAVTTDLRAAVNDPEDSALSMETLGLRRQDLPALMRLAVVVEGAHDVAVVESIAASEIAEHWASVLPMRGGDSARSVVDAQLLMSMTDAKVLVVLDHISNDDLHPRWSALREAHADGDRPAVEKALSAIRGLRGVEATWLAELGARAHAIDRLDRLHVFGLSKPDIIEYFDPAAFKLTESWDDLESEYLDLPRPRPAFKQWLRESKGGSVSTGRVADAARSLGEPHPDLTDLVHEIRRLGLQSHL